MKKYLKYGADIVPVVAFVVISLMYFWNPIVGGKVLTGSDHTGAVGAGVEIQQYGQEHPGETLRWTNTLFCGMPTYQMSPSYKSTQTLSRIENVYKLWLPNYAVYIFLYLLGFYIMLRCFDFRVWMAALGAVLWAFSSYFFIIIAAGHIWKVMTLAFIPPVIGGMALCYERGKYLWGIAVSALFMGLQILSNHVQMTYYFLFVIGLMALGWLVQAIMGPKSFSTSSQQASQSNGSKGSREGLLQWFKASCAFAVGCILGVAMNASNLYHTWEYSKESMRGKSELTQKTKDPKNQTSSGLERDYITAWSYGIDETWTLLIPNAKGGASVPLAENKTAMEKADNQYLSIYQQMGQYWGDQPGTSGPVYVGAFVCFLFILCLLIVRGPVCWSLLLATMLSVALSWGRNFMGFTDFFLDYVPMYDKFRTVASILVIAEFTMPLMAVMALKRFIEEPDSIHVRIPYTNKKVNALALSFSLTAGFCLLFYLMPGVFFGNYMSQQEQEMFQNAIQAGYIPQDVYAGIVTNLTEMREAVFTADCMRSFVIIVIGSALLLLYYFKKLKAVPMVLGITLLCLVDMWSVNKRYLNDGMFQYNRPVEQIFQKSMADEQILQDPDKYYRTLDLANNTFNSNDASYWHKSIGGYHAAKLRRYQEVIEAHISGEMSKIGSHIMQTENRLLLSGGDSIFPVLDMLNTKYMIVPLKDDQKVAVENPSAMGNAWFVSNIKVAGDADDELADLSKVNLRTTAVVGKDFAGVVKDATSDSTATVRLTDYAPDALGYEINSKKGGVIVFSDIYYPGWKAMIDGEETPVGRADYILRAINVPAGKHKVIMTFDPQTIYTTESIAYSAIGIVFIIVIGLGVQYGLKRRKKTQKA